MWSNVANNEVGQKRQNRKACTEPLEIISVVALFAAISTNELGIVIHLDVGVYPYVRSALLVSS